MIFGKVTVKTILLILFLLPSILIPMEQGVKPALKIMAPWTMRTDIVAAAHHEGIPEEIITAVSLAESSWRSDAVSPSGAIGFMQIMPQTGLYECGLTTLDLFERRSNIFCGAKYLKKMYARYGSWDLAFAAYNSGPLTVDKAKGIPAIPETHAYVKRINRYLKEGVK